MTNRSAPRRRRLWRGQKAMPTTRSKLSWPNGALCALSKRPWLFRPNNMSKTQIGPPRNRVDGRLKVTGAAKYAVEFEFPYCAHAWTIESNIAKGKIVGIDDSAAQLAHGVLAVLTHLNTPKFKPIPKR